MTDKSNSVAGDSHPKSTQSITYYRCSHDKCASKRLYRCTFNYDHIKSRYKCTNYELITSENRCPRPVGHAFFNNGGVSNLPCGQWNCPICGRYKVQDALYKTDMLFNLNHYNNNNQYSQQNINITVDTNQKSDPHNPRTLKYMIITDNKQYDLDDVEVCKISKSKICKIKNKIACNLTDIDRCRLGQDVKNLTKKWAVFRSNLDDLKLNNFVWIRDTNPQNIFSMHVIVDTDISDNKLKEFWLKTTKNRGHIDIRPVLELDKTLNTIAEIIIESIHRPNFVKGLHHVGFSHDASKKLKTFDDAIKEEKSKRNIKKPAIGICSHKTKFKYGERIEEILCFHGIDSTGRAFQTRKDYGQMSLTEWFELYSDKNEPEPVHDITIDTIKDTIPIYTIPIYTITSEQQQPKLEQSYKPNIELISEEDIREEYIRPKSKITTERILTVECMITIDDIKSSIDIQNAAIEITQILEDEYFRLLYDID